MLTAAEGTERDRKRFGSVGVAHQMSQCFPPPSLCSPDCRLKGSPRGSRGQSCGGQGEFVGGAHLTGAGVCETPQAPEQRAPPPPDLAAGEAKAEIRASLCRHRAQHFD